MLCCAVCVHQVVLRGKGLPGGKLMARRDWSVVELLMTSPPPPTTWLGVQAVRAAARAAGYKPPANLVQERLVGSGIVVAMVRAAARASYSCLPVAAAPLSYDAFTMFCWPVYLCHM